MAAALRSVLATKPQEKFIGRDSPSRVTRRSDRDNVTAGLQLTDRIRSLDIVDVRRLRRLKIFWRANKMTCGVLQDHMEFRRTVIVRNFALDTQLAGSRRNYECSFLIATRLARKENDCKGCTGVVLVARICRRGGLPGSRYSRVGSMLNSGRWWRLVMPKLHDRKRAQK